jgi:2,4-dienoyl-CoA reductase-like NADH-dependent reductase (Old Yellow Enzyme family)/thioredoxin reductase
MTKLVKLFEPGNIGGMAVKNRIVMSPMGTISHNPDGSLKDEVADYYAERAKGGVGLIMGQTSTVLREAAAPMRTGTWDDKFIPGLRRVADAIHQYDTKCAFQLTHHGRLLTQYRHMVPQGEEIRPIAPSAIPRLLTETQIPRAQDAGVVSPWVADNEPAEEASKEDIKRIKGGFAEAARRVKQAGFDAVEVHGGHGYLISQFLSPLVNRRTDEYGGSTEKRARFACEVIEAVREKVGADFPIIFRLSGSDFLEGGINIDEVVLQSPLFVEAGADALDISASEQASIQWQYPSYLFPSGPLVPLAERIKKAVKVPVITVGRIGDPILAEEILRQGKADFIAMGRALLADPELANKAKEGRFDDIRRCVYCLNCFYFGAHPHILSEGLACTVNPALLREKKFQLQPTVTPKRVMVIGGGPAGMEAARTLAERGHQVTLYEKTDKLGGQWYIACQQEQKKQDFPHLVRHLSRGLDKAGVEVKLNTEVTPQLVKDENPNAMVIATGATPQTLNIPGADGKSVVQATDVILGKAKVGQRVVVVGGRYVGLEIADQLADQSKRVTLVTRRALGRAIERNIYLALRNRLIEKGVQLFANSPVVEIRDKGVYIAFEGDLVFLKADTVVLAVGVKPESQLIETLKGISPEVYAIGDCVEPRDAMWAIREGAEIARRI